MKLIKSSIPKSRLRYYIISTLIILALIAYSIPLTIGLFASLVPNEAKAEANPIEKALVEAGGIKKCENSYNGRSSDGRVPSYNIRMQFNADKEDTTKIIKQVFESQGFKLVKTESNNYSFIESYYDHTTKQSRYSGLAEGNITVSVRIYSTKEAQSKLNCGLLGQALIMDDSHTAITFALGLPSRNE